MKLLIYVLIAGISSCHQSAIAADDNDGNWKWTLPSDPEWTSVSQTPQEKAAAAVASKPYTYTAPTPVEPSKPNLLASATYMDTYRGGLFAPKFAQLFTLAKKVRSKSSALRVAHIAELLTSEVELSVLSHCHYTLCAINDRYAPVKAALDLQEAITLEALNHVTLR